MKPVRETKPLSSFESEEALSEQQTNIVDNEEEVCSRDLPAPKFLNEELNKLIFSLLHGQLLIHPEHSKEIATLYIISVIQIILIELHKEKENSKPEYPEYIESFQQKVINSIKEFEVKRSEWQQFESKLILETINLFKGIAGTSTKKLRQDKFTSYKYQDCFKRTSNSLIELIKSYPWVQKDLPATRAFVYGEPNEGVNRLVGEAFVQLTKEEQIKASNKLQKFKLTIYGSEKTTEEIEKLNKKSYAKNNAGLNNRETFDKQINFGPKFDSEATKIILKRDGTQKEASVMSYAVDGHFFTTTQNTAPKLTAPQPAFFSSVSPTEEEGEASQKVVSSDGNEILKKSIVPEYKS